MATYVLIHGGAGAASSWDLVPSALSRRGHEAVAMDLPCDDPDAGWSDYVNTVVDAAGEQSDLVVVAHSVGGFVAPLVCERVPVGMLVLLAGMIPSPGETFSDWWTNTGHAREVRLDWEDLDTFYNGVPSDLVAADIERGEGRKNVPNEPWPLAAWPDVPTKSLLCHDDRVFPPGFMRRVARERLGIEADEMDGGHGAILSHPDELADRLNTYWKEM